MKPAVYLRTSSTVQADANGSDSQRVAITRWLIAQGIDPSTVPEFCDEGVSGKSMDRPQWKALETKLAAGEFDTVITYSLSRVGRSAIHVLETVQRLQGLGVRPVFIKEGLDPSTHTGKLTLGILASIAEYEREIIRERVTDGLRARKAKGLPIGRQVNPKITPEKWKEVYALHDQGARSTDLARGYGVRLNYMSRQLAAYRRSKGA